VWRGFSAFVARCKFAFKRAAGPEHARELGPQGIHVAHPIIDRAIDPLLSANTFPERYALIRTDGILSIPSILPEQ